MDPENRNGGGETELVYEIGKLFKYLVAESCAESRHG